MFRWLPLLLLAGVSCRHSPPISPQQQRRICADLCQSGLGGAPCGDVCLDLTPRGIPLQSPGLRDRSNGTDTDVTVNTRSDACPVLCKNHLGEPLCQCDEPVKQHKRRKVDFRQICDYYCQHQDWVLRGCPSCTNAAARQDGRQAVFLQDGAAVSRMANIPGLGTSFTPVAGRKVDWTKWCEDQCSVGNGGSACNCDILPFSLQ